MNFLGIIPALLFPALFFFLFNAGMSTAFKKVQKSKYAFVSSLANGWALGWLFLIIPIILWLFVLFLMFFLSGADTGLDLEISAIIIFFGGIIVLALTPGINIAKRVRTQYPTLSSKKIAAIWALVYLLCLIPIGIIATLIKYFNLLSSRWDIYMLLPGALLINLLLSRAVGKRLTLRQLQNIVDPPAPSITERVSPTEHPPLVERVPLIEHIPPSWVTWLKTPSVSRAKAGWALVWLIISFGAIRKFEFPRGISPSTFWGYAASFGILLAIIVPSGAGIISALLQRDSNTSQEQSLERGENCFIAGIKGWAFALFATFIIFSIYELTQRSISYRITSTLERVAKDVVSSGGFWYTSAVISLLAAYFSPKGKKSKKVEQVEKKPITQELIIRGAIIWVPVWILLTWVVVNRFAIFGMYMPYDLFGIMLRYCLQTVSIVSISAGLSAAIIMREISTSWSQTGENALNWILSGLLGWVIGIPIASLIVTGIHTAINFSSLMTPDRKGRISGPTLLEEIAQPSLLLGGLIALVVGYQIFKTLSTSD